MLLKKIYKKAVAKMKAKQKMDLDSAGRGWVGGQDLAKTWSQTCHLREVPWTVRTLMTCFSFKDEPVTWLHSLTL